MLQIHDNLKPSYKKPKNCRILNNNKKSDFRIEMKKMLNNMLPNWKNFKGHWTTMKNSRISCFTNPMIVLLQPISLRRNVIEVLIKCPLSPTFIRFYSILFPLPTSTNLYSPLHNSSHFYSITYRVFIRQILITSKLFSLTYFREKRGWSQRLGKYQTIQRGIWTYQAGCGFRFQPGQNRCWFHQGTYF